MDIDGVSNITAQNGAQTTRFDIALDNGLHNFGGTVGFTGETVTFSVVDGISLGAGNAAGLSVTSTNGAILDTEGNALTIDGTGIFTAEDAMENRFDISLDNRLHSFGSVVSFTGRDVAISGTGDISLGRVTANNLTVDAIGGEISDTAGLDLTITETSDFTAESADRETLFDITLNTGQHNLGQFVTFRGNNVALSSTQELTLGTGRADGDLFVTSTGGRILDTNGAVLSGVGTISFTAESLDETRFDIVLDNGLHRFSGAVDLVGEDVTLTETGLVRLGIVDAGSLSATALNGAILDGGGNSVSVTGDVDLTARSGDDLSEFNISLDNGNHSLGGTVTFRGEAVTLAADSALTLGAGQAASLTVSSTGGDISDTGGGVLDIDGTAQFTAQDDDGNSFDIVLDNGLHILGGQVDFIGADVTLISDQQIALGDGEAVDLVVTSTGGRIIDTDGLALEISGTSRLTAQDPSGAPLFNIVLDNGEHDFDGAVTFTGRDVILSANDTITLASGSAASLDVSTSSGAILDTDNLALDIGGTANFSAGAGSNLFDVSLGNGLHDFDGVVSFTGASVTFSVSDQITLGGGTADALEVTSTGGSIADTQDGEIVVDGTARFTAMTDETDPTLFDITLSNGRNAFGSFGATGDTVSVTEVDNIALIGLEASVLNATSTSGLIFDRANEVLNVDGAATFTTEASNSITINTAENTFGSFNADGSNVTLELDQAAALGTISAVNLTVTSDAGIGEAARSKISVSGAATLTAEGNAITLDTADNEHDFRTLSATGSIVSIDDVNRIELDAVNATDLSIEAGGRITDIGTISVTRDTSFIAENRAGTTRFDIVLDEGTHAFDEPVELRGADVTLSAAEGLALGDIIATTLDVTARGGAIIDAENAELQVTGLANFVAQNQNGTSEFDVTIDNADNSLGAIAGAGDAVTLVSPGAIALATIDANSLSVTAGGDITEASTSAVSVSGDATLDAGNNRIDLNDTVDTHDFDGEVTLTGSEVALDDIDGIQLSSVTAGSLDIDAGGAITDTVGQTISVSGASTFDAIGSDGSRFAVELDNAMGPGGHDFNRVGGSGAEVTLIDQDGIALTDLDADRLTVMAGGTITDSAGATITVTNDTTLEAVDQSDTLFNITLDNASNDFNAITFRALNARINDSNGLSIFDSAASRVTLTAGDDLALDVVTADTVVGIAETGDISASNLQASEVTLGGAGTSAGSSATADGDISLTRFQVDTLVANTSEDLALNFGEVTTLLDISAPRQRYTAFDFTQLTGTTSSNFNDFVGDPADLELLVLDRIRTEGDLTAAAQEIRTGFLEIGGNLSLTATAGDVAKLADADIEFASAGDAAATITGARGAQDAVISIEAFEDLLVVGATTDISASGDILFTRGISTVDGSDVHVDFRGEVRLNGGNAALEDRNDLRLGDTTLTGDFAARSNADNLGSDGTITQTSSSSLDIAGEASFISGQHGAGFNPDVTAAIQLDSDTNAFSTVQVIGDRVVLGDRDGFSVTGGAVNTALTVGSAGDLQTGDLGFSDLTIAGELAFNSTGNVVLERIRQTGAAGLSGDGIDGNAAGSITVSDLLASDTVVLNTGGILTLERFDLTDLTLSGATGILRDGNASGTLTFTDTAGISLSNLDLSLAEIRSTSTLTADALRAEALDLVATGDVSLGTLEVSGAGSSLQVTSLQGQVTTTAGFTAMPADVTVTAPDQRTLGFDASALVTSLDMTGSDPTDNRVGESLQSQSDITLARDSFDRLVQVEGTTSVAAATGIDLIRQTDNTGATRHNQFDGPVAFSAAAGNVTIEAASGLTLDGGNVADGDLVLRSNSDNMSNSASIRQTGALRVSGKSEVITGDHLIDAVSVDGDTLSDIILTDGENDFAGSVSFIGDGVRITNGRDLTVVDALSHGDVDLSAPGSITVTSLDAGVFVDSSDMLLPDDQIAGAELTITVTDSSAGAPPASSGAVLDNVRAGNTEISTGETTVAGVPTAQDALITNSMFVAPEGAGADDNSLSVTTSGTATIADVTAGNMSISGGDVSATRLTGANLTITAARDADLVTVDASDTTITAGGEVSLTSATLADVRVSGTRAVTSDLTAGDLVVDVTGDADLGIDRTLSTTVMADGSATITAINAGEVSVETQEAAVLDLETASSIDVRSQGTTRITADDAGRISVDATGDATLNVMRAADIVVATDSAASVTAGNAGNVDVTRSMTAEVDLEAAGDVDIASSLATTLTAGNVSDVIVDAETDAVLDLGAATSTDVKAGGSISLTATGAGDTVLDATSVTGNRLTTDDLAVTATGDVLFEDLTSEVATISAGGDVTLTRTTLAATDTVLPGGLALDLSVSGSTEIDILTSDAPVHIRGGDNVDLTAVVAEGAIRIDTSASSTPANVDLTQIRVTAVLDENGDPVSDTITSLEIDASGSVGLDDIDVSAAPASVAAIDVTAGDAVMLQDIQADELNITAAGAIVQNGNPAEGISIEGATSLSARNGDDLFAISLVNDENDFGTLSAEGSVLTLTEANDIDLNEISVDEMIVVAGGSIGQTSGGAIRVEGLSDISSAEDITLDNAMNDFGSVASDGQNITLRDENGIVLGQTQGASLAVTTDGGSITQIDTPGSEIVVLGATTLSAVDNEITLETPANDFATVSASADRISLADENGIALDLVNATTSVEVRAGGTISQTATGAVSTARADLVAGADITLDSADNDFSEISAAGTQVAIADQNEIEIARITAETLTVSAGGNIEQSRTPDTQINVAGATTLTAGANDILLDAEGNDFNTVSATGDEVALGDINEITLDEISGSALQVTAGDDIDQTATGSLLITGTVDLQAGGDISLTNTANRFESVSVAGQDVQFAVQDEIVLNRSTVTDLEVVAGGNITQVADPSGEAALVVTGTANLTSRNGDITLDEAGNDFGTVNADGGSISLTDANDVTLATINGSNVTVTSLGGDIAVSGEVRSTADISLSSEEGRIDAAALMAVGTASLDAADGISITEVTAERLVAESKAAGVELGNVMTGEDITVTANGGSIDLTGKLSSDTNIDLTNQSGGIDGSAEGASIDANGAASFEASGDISLRDVTSDELLILSTDGGVVLNEAVVSRDRLIVQALNGAINGSQAAITAQSDAVFDAAQGADSPAGNDIDLSNPGNRFYGGLAILRSNNVSLQGTGDLNFGLPEGTALLSSVSSPNANTVGNQTIGDIVALQGFSIDPMIEAVLRGQVAGLVGGSWSVTSDGNITFDGTLDAIPGGAGNLTLRTTTNNNILFTEYTGAGGRLGDISIDGAQNVVIGGTSPTGPGLLDNLSETNTFRARSMQLANIEGTVRTARNDQTDLRFDNFEAFFGVDLTGNIFISSNVNNVDLTGTLGGTGVNNRDIGILPIGPRSTDFTFNNCIIGDVSDCSRQVAPFTAPQVELIQPDLFDIDFDDLADVYVNFGNEELWVVPNIYLQDTGGETQ